MHKIRDLPHWKARHRAVFCAIYYWYNFPPFALIGDVGVVVQQPGLIGLVEQAPLPQWLWIFTGNVR